MDRISIKTGAHKRELTHKESNRILTENALIVSSYRLTKVSADLPTMKNYLDNIDFEDSFLCLFQENLNYLMYFFPSSIVDLHTIDWKAAFYQSGKKIGQHSGWVGTSANGISAKVSFSMSSQLWFNIPLGLIEPFRHNIVDINGLRSNEVIETEELDAALAMVLV